MSDKWEFPKRERCRAARETKAHMRGSDQRSAERRKLDNSFHKLKEGTHWRGSRKRRKAKNRLMRLAMVHPHHDPAFEQMLRTGEWPSDADGPT